MVQLRNAPTGRVLSDNLARSDTLESTSGPQMSVEELRQRQDKVVELRDEKTKLDVDALEKAYRTLPKGSFLAGNLVRSEAMSLAPLLASYPGQVEDTRLAESTLSRMGLDPKEVGKSWSSGQRDYYVRMIGLAADKALGEGHHLREHGAVDPGVAREIYRRTKGLV